MIVSQHTLYADKPRIQKSINTKNLRSIELTGAVHHNVKLTLYHLDGDIPNKFVVRLVKYVTNPFYTYETDLPGDYFLRVEADKYYTKQDIYDLVDKIQQEKESKSIPSELLKWSKERIDYFDKQISNQRYPVREQYEEAKLVFTSAMECYGESLHI